MLHVCYPIFVEIAGSLSLVCALKKATIFIIFLQSNQDFANRKQTGLLPETVASAILFFKEKLVKKILVGLKHGL